METAMAAAGEETDASPLDPRHAPLLLFGHDGGQASDGNDASFFLYSIPSKRALHRRLVEMEDHRYWTTPQGWLVMAARGSPVTFLWDPFTGARISLPPDREGFLGGGPKRCLLSCKPVLADPTSCIVLVVDLAQTVLWYCRLGDGDQWRKHEYDFAAIGGDGATLDAVLWFTRRLTSAGGKFYMYLYGKVVVLDFSPEPVFTTIPADMNSATRPPCNGEVTEEFVESHGNLFCVRFSRSSYLQTTRLVVGMVVFKLDLSAQTWVTVKSLGSRAFIVHEEFGGSFDPQEAGGLRGDCIYYCLPNDEGLYVHDMERGTTALRNPRSGLGDRCSSTKVLMPTC